jgi:hypothetical protein
MTVKKSVTAAGADAQPNGEVGLFWIVEHQRQPFVLAVSVSTGAAQRYGDHLMLDLGHHEHWNALAVRGATALRAAGLPTASTKNGHAGEFPSMCHGAALSSLLIANCTIRISSR